MLNVLALIGIVGLAPVYAADSGVPLGIFKLSCNDNQAPVGKKVVFKLFVGKKANSADPTEVLVYLPKSGKLTLVQQFDVKSTRKKIDSMTKQYAFSAPGFDLAVKVYKYQMAYVIGTLSAKDPKGNPLPADLRCTPDVAALDDL